MATIVPTVVLLGKQDGSIKRITWTPVTENDTCAPVALPEYADKSLQVLGTFGSASVALQGSNDGGATYAALNIPAGTALAITAAGVKAVLENTELVKPVVTGGTSQSLTIVMVARLSNTMRT